MIEPINPLPSDSPVPQPDSIRSDASDDPTLLGDCIARHAARVPDKVAFRCQGATITYGELHLASQRLAGVLQSVGVQPGDRVAVVMPRCIESAIGLYGILAAGAVFVPLDASAPPATLCDSIAQCQISVVLGHPSLARQLDSLASCAAQLRLVVGAASSGDQDRGGVARGPMRMGWGDVHRAEPTGERITRRPCDAAYIIHTSGSTGTPKGIVHTHRSGLAYARLSARTYAIDEHDIIGSHAPLHTDMSTLGFLTGPHVGACTVIVSDAHLRMPASLCALIGSERISIWYSVPLALVQMMASGGLAGADLSTLRWVLFGGEPFATSRLRELVALLPHVRFSNVYGPAETNQCTNFDLSADALHDGLLDAARPVPIGRVWAQTSALVLDEDDQTVPPGGEGELLIHSVTMMRGYWQRPELDARAFFVDTRTGPPRRYYRTGDFVRVGRDGVLHLVGRRDRQVKVRGFRIELDHVEQVLCQHPDVLEAAAFTVFDASVNTRALHAAVIARTERFRPDSLLAHVRTAIGDAATPQFLHRVDAFPRTTSGKVDRRQLSARLAG